MNDDRTRNLEKAFELLTQAQECLQDFATAENESLIIGEENPMEEHVLSIENLVQDLDSTIGDVQTVIDFINGE